MKFGVSTHTDNLKHTDHQNLPIL